MPLRDHFRPPVSKRHSWEGFHATWPAMLVGRMQGQLPARFTAEPRVHLGAYFEIDVGGFETNTDDEPPPAVTNSSVSTLVAPAPTLTLDVDLGEQYEYEVLVFDQERDRTLVAAVEFVSPANKDRAEHRTAFVTKCAALLQKGVCVAIIDPVTIRRANLYLELLTLFGRDDPTFRPTPPVTYAVACRSRTVDRRSRLENWAHHLVIGQPLPGLPLWITPDTSLTLDLEGSYEDTCRILGIA
ncbi:MAG TPA: DUF4058 family protein [Gemmataceae bacterium]|nr:DUF4058 family protein [Gemmataceae bacterium]